MGFMDKAKKLAEQAQQKLDDAQQNFNQGGSTQGQQDAGARYDQHGRPVEGEDAPAAAAPEAPAGEAPPAGETPPPSAQPDEPKAEGEPKPEGQADAAPDPFRPMQQ
jgi:hypothetical protein